MISAIVFDLDGTVLSNEPNWEEAVAVVAQRHSIPELKRKKLTVNGWWHEPGLGIEPSFKRILEATLLETILDAGALTREAVQFYREQYADDVQLREGIEDAVQLAKDRGWQTGLCTGSIWEVVQKELEMLSMQLAFDVTVTGDEILLGKPDPEIYFLAANKLGVEPEECVVVEDAIAGVRAAVEAGMKVVGLASEYAPREMLMSAGATFVMNDMSELIDIIKAIE